MCDAHDRSLAFVAVTAELKTKSNQMYVGDAAKWRSALLQSLSALDDDDDDAEEEKGENGWTVVANQSKVDDSGVLGCLLLLRETRGNEKGSHQQ